MKLTKAQKEIAKTWTSHFDCVRAYKGILGFTVIVDEPGHIHLYKCYTLKSIRDGYCYKKKRIKKAFEDLLKHDIRVAKYELGYYDKKRA
jgi:hypothetical protein